MVLCGLEIVVAVLAATTAVAGAIAGVSELMPFFKKISSNGIIHSVYHLLSKKDKCKKEDVEEVVEDAAELVEDITDLVNEINK